jgi:hypothetical protein
MKLLLKKCDELFKSLPCCHENNEDCNCYECLKDGYYGGKETYSCLKKLCYYTMNYGPCYSSEMYHFFSESKILEKFQYNSIDILSLGAGFGPDLYGIIKYIKDKDLKINYNYTGIDKEVLWENIRINNSRFITKDVLSDNINLKNYDIIIINKLFSTLRSVDLHNNFLDKLKNEMMPTLSNNSYLIFSDVNSINMGRDEIIDELTPLFKHRYVYFFNVKKSFRYWYFKSINEIDNVFSIPDNICVDSKKDVNNTAIIVFKKG